MHGKYKVHKLHQRYYYYALSLCFHDIRHSAFSYQKAGHRLFNMQHHLGVRCCCWLLLHSTNLHFWAYLLRSWADSLHSEHEGETGIDISAQVLTEELRNSPLPSMILSLWPDVTAPINYTKYLYIYNLEGFFFCRFICFDHSAYIFKLS